MLETVVMEMHASLSMMCFIDYLFTKFKSAFWKLQQKKQSYCKVCLWLWGGGGGGGGRDETCKAILVKFIMFY